MNSKLLLVIEFVLLAGYLALVFLVLDLSKLLNLILLGASTLILFLLVWLLEKKREKLKVIEEGPPQVLPGAGLGQQFGEQSAFPPPNPGQPPSRPLPPSQPQPPR